MKRAACGLLEMRDAKNRQKLAIYGYHRTTLSGHISANKARINNRKKLAKQQYLVHMSPQYGELQPANG